MTDWMEDLDAALTSGDPAFMKAMLVRVPKDVLQRAIPYLERLAKDRMQDGQAEDALTCYNQLIEIAPGVIRWHVARAQILLKLDRFSNAMVDANRVVELQPELGLGYRLQAEAHEGLLEWSQAVAMFKKALSFAPEDEQVKQRIAVLDTQIRKEALLKQSIDPDTAAQSLAIELPSRPEVTFHPALFDDPSIPESYEKPMVEGLQRLLWRYSGHQSVKNSLSRLEDPCWLDGWDLALAATAGSKVLFRGSELGTFALRAVRHGALNALAVEPFPFDARIATGIVQKHFLAAWHAQHGDAIASWTGEERRKSFEAFAHRVDVVPPNSDALDTSRCNYFVFPNIDHSLLGTGIAKEVRQYRKRGLASNVRVLPAGARIYAQGIQWTYGSTPFRLEPLNDIRWSLYPKALEFPEDSWAAVTESIEVGEIDFENFAEAVWDVHLRGKTNGTLNAIMFWFDLNLGGTEISSAPGSMLRCIRPAVQHVDAMAVEKGRLVRVEVHVEETRLHFRARPAAGQIRSHEMADWYIPMVVDQRRSDAYRASLDRAVASYASRTVLDIGAGCGLSAMMAAQAGATRVVGCEVNPTLAKIGRDVLKINGLDDKVVLVNKDCRHMKVPGDLSERADLAVIEVFDCSLIGEDVLHILAYAREHLLQANARYLPKSARIRAMVVEHRMERIWDLDVNLLNPYRFSPNFINVDADKLAYRALTEPFDLFIFDFSTATAVAQERELLVGSIAEGTAGAVLFWFDLQLDETCWITNSPNEPDKAHWKQGLQFLPEAPVKPALQLPLVAKHDGHALTFRWGWDELPGDQSTRLPRFDPRWLAATNELDQQMRSVLQHCNYNADAFTKVVELAKRFAIDPATYDLDPAIAQRFVSRFFT